jgi:hypothetical protein
LASIIPKGRLRKPKTECARDEESTRDLLVLYMQFFQRIKMRWQKLSPVGGFRHLLNLNTISRRK